MKINQDNYEQYFLDHAEGNLSPEMERELADFLEANPDLKPVLNDFDPLPLQTVKIRNEILKSRLKKNLHPTDHINEANIDEWMIREIEGQLDEANEKELKEFLSLNPAYNFDYKLFGLTKLVPDLAIGFPRKNTLKKKGLLIPVSRLAWILSATAATIILLIGIRYFQKPETDSVLPVISSEVHANAVVTEPDSPGTETKVTEAVKQEIGTPSPEFTAGIPRSASFRIQQIENQFLTLQNAAEMIEVTLVPYDVTPLIIIDHKDKPLIAKVFGNMIAQARDGFRKNTSLEKIEKPDFNIWSIAKAGINGYNSVSDRDLELYVRRDAEGKIKSYALLEQDHLILSKDLKKN